MSSSSSRATGDATSSPTLEAIRAVARERDWPDELAVRIAEAGVPLSALRSWGWLLDAERAEAQLDWHERMLAGEIQGREAALSDDEAFSRLWANSPEHVGDWEITTYREPLAFAQYQLQENVRLAVLAQRTELVACCVWSRRNVLVQGRRLSVTYGQALRVHADFRRRGFGDQVRRLSWTAAHTRPHFTQYDIMRSQNFAVVNWWKKYNPDFFDHTPAREGEVPGIPVSVHQIPARAQGESGARVRPTRREDVPRCVELINRTHAGLDLFRPYTADFLENALDEGFWGERPEWWQPVYAWPDHFVLEHRDRIVACAGLWDRGANVRERWRRRGADQADPGRVVASADVLDWGFEAGAEEAMAALLRRLVDRAHGLGRDFLSVPLQHLPELAAKLSDLGPAVDERYLRWGGRDPVVERPYTDLRYW